MTLYSLQLFETPTLTAR